MVTMKPPESTVCINKTTGMRDDVKAPSGWLLRPFAWLVTTIGFLFRVVLILWAALAIYYSNLPWAWLRLLLSVAFIAFSVWALWLTRRRQMSLVFACVFVGVLVWWISIQPSHDREWRPEVTVTPRAIIDGDRVRIPVIATLIIAAGTISLCDTKSARSCSLISPRWIFLSPTGR